MIPLSLIPTIPTVSTNSTDQVCAYAISGQYGPSSRYLFYLLLSVGAVFHQVDWLIGVTLATCMLTGCISAVHGVALAVVRGTDTVDLDIVPVFSIVTVGMLAAPQMLAWSTTFRNSEGPVRIMVYIWVVLMMVGVTSSVLSVRQLPVGMPCDEEDPSNCTFACSENLRMRDGQPVIPVLFWWKDYLPWYTTLFLLFCPLHVLLYIVFGSSGQRPPGLVSSTSQNNAPPDSQEQQASNVQSWAFKVPAICWIVIPVHIIVTELMMMGRQPLPLSESMSAVVQWGPLVGSFVALCARLITAWSNIMLTDWKRRNEERAQHFDVALQALNDHHTPTIDSSDGISQN